MEIRSVVCSLFIFGCILLTPAANACNDCQNRQNPYLATDSRYDHIYANPPKQSLGAYGRYIVSSGTVRYVHSPSRLKGVKHAARINANNRYAYGY